MNKSPTSLLRAGALVVLICGITLCSTSASARGGHGGGGFHGGGFRGGGYGRHFGGHFRGPGVGLFVGPGIGLWGSGYGGFGYGYGGYGYGYPYYYPPAIAVPATPPVYIERAPVTNYWYYCWSPAGYYPTVKACPGGWQAVPPSAPPP